MSELEKPFDIPEHWHWSTFEGIGEWTGGGTPSKQKPSYWEGDIPWVSPKDMKRLEIGDTQDHVTETALEDSATNRVPENSLLFVTRSGILERTLPTARATAPVTINQDLKALTLSEEVCPKFLLYYTRAAKRSILRQCSKHGTTVASLESSRLYRFPVAIPPLPEQRRIVAKIEELFSNLDAGMDDLQAAGQQLERYRLSVLQAAVEGRLTADWRRNHDPEPADQLLGRILEKRRDRWEEDYRTKRYDSKGKTPPDGWKDRYSEPDSVDSHELPSLSSSWKWVRFEQISLLDSGYAFSSDKFTDEGMPLLRGANVAPGHLKWVDTEYWPEDEVGPYEHLIVEEGDIILAMDRPLINAGLKIARAEESDTPCLLVQRVARFKPVFESLTSFLYLTCCTQRFIAHLREGQTGTQIPHVSKKSLRAYPVPLPPLTEQKQIVDEVERLLSVADDAAATAEREETRAKRLRQSILKRAFSGQLVPHDEDAAPPSIDAKASEETDTGSRNDAGSDFEDLMGSADPSKQIEMDL
jgi:type I restriction enzyme S subunit